MSKIITIMPTDKRFKDRTGEIYNSWEIIGFSHLVLNQKSGQRTNYWNCRCLKCGVTVKPVAHNNLTSGQSKSCRSCVKRDENREDISGKMYGQLEVLSLNEEETRLARAAQYNTKCHVCGTESIKPAAGIRAGKIKSCGSRSCRTAH